MTDQKYLNRNEPILVFIGPSGTGKSTLVRKLLRTGVIELTPTWTDRPRRKDEEELEHKFVDSAGFDRLIEGGFFAHTPLTFFGLPYRYAMPLMALPAQNHTPALMARVSTINLLSKFYPNRIIYQIEAPESAVVKRLQARGQELGTRLSSYQAEIADGRKIANRIILNDSNIDECFEIIMRALREDFNL